MAFSWIDLVVVIAYIVAITAFGARFRKGQRTLRDYFLGGNRLPWWAITLSIVCAETSILTIISTPGISYRSNLGVPATGLRVFVGARGGELSFHPALFRRRTLHRLQLIERRFGHGLRLFTAGLFLLTRALAEGVRVFAISIVIAIIFKTGVAASLVIIFVLTLLYTLEGGLTAVIWTDVIQLTIYVAGTVVALFVALHTLPGGWGEVVRVAHAAGGKFTVFNFHFNWSQPYLFWTGLVGGMFLNTASHGTDQLIVQQLLAARSRRQSQGALLASGVVVLLQFSLVPGGGSGALRFLPAFSSHRSLQPARPDLSHLRHHPASGGTLRPADRCDPRCRHGQSERGAQFPGVEFGDGFLQALRAPPRR